MLNRSVYPRVRQISRSTRAAGRRKSAGGQAPAGAVEVIDIAAAIDLTQMGEGRLAAIMGVALIGSAALAGILFGA